MLIFKRIISSLLLMPFLMGTAMPAALASQMPWMPQPGAMVISSPVYMPAMIKGLKIHQDNPLLFDFIIDTGNSGLSVGDSRNNPEAGDEKLRNESRKLIKYFLAALTIKEDNLWVNLSPYEKDRMIPEDLGKTELGRDMLAQDYVLKQLTASMIYPEKDLGKAFWGRVYAQALERYGTSDIPIDTFNKVWIVADKARVLEHEDTAYVVGGHLKVMLESDYKAAQEAVVVSEKEVGARAGDGPGAGYYDRESQELAKNVVRDIIVPEIEKEVNDGRNFAPLRQMFFSMILASWYKQALKEALLNQVYTNKGKTGGVQSDDPAIKEQIYNQYLEAYKKGVFNYIKEESDGELQELPANTSRASDAALDAVIVRKYFSGGTDFAMLRTGLERTRDVAEGAGLFSGQIVQETVRIQSLDNGMGVDKLPAMDSVLQQYPQDPYLMEVRVRFLEIVKNSSRGNMVSFHNAFHLNELFYFVDAYLKEAPMSEHGARLIREAVFRHDEGYYLLKTEEGTPNYISAGHEDVAIANVKQEKPNLEGSLLAFLISHTKVVFDKDFNAQIGMPQLPAIDEVMVREAAVYEDISRVLSQEALEISDATRTFLDEQFSGQWSVSDLGLIREMMVGARIMATADIYGHGDNMVALIPGLWQEFYLEANRALKPTMLEQITGTIDLFIESGIFYKNRLRHIIGDGKILQIPLMVQESRDKNLQRIDMEMRQPLMRMADQIKAGGDFDVEERRSVFKYIDSLTLSYPGAERFPLTDTISQMKVEVDTFLDNVKPDPAMKSNEQEKMTPGGIDFNAARLGLDIVRDGRRMEMKIDPALMADFQRGDFSGVVPVILQMVPIHNPLPVAIK
ncbi:MAG: hypothetical protein V2A70_03890 [Candidatus Omnitrophota bacterium]